MTLTLCVLRGRGRTFRVIKLAMYTEHSREKATLSTRVCVCVSGHSGSWGLELWQTVGVRQAGGYVHIRTCGKGLGRPQKHCWDHLRGFKQPGWALTSGSLHVPLL